MKKLLFCFFFVTGTILSHNMLTDKDYQALADSLSKHGKIGEAIRYYKKALTNNSRNTMARINIIVEYLKTQQYEKALKHLHKFLTFYPQSFFALKRMGCLLSRLGKLNEAIEYLKKALQVNPDAIEIHDKLGIAYLGLGDVKNGYKHFDIYLEKDEKESPRLWKGENLFGKTIYLWDTVGAGDVFCYIRYAKQLKEQGATVILGLRESMIPFVSSFKYVDKIMPRTEKTSFDYYLHMHKMPRMAYKAGFKIVTDIPYLYADEALVKKWKKAFTDDTNLKVGVCWSANVYKNRAGKKVKNERSIPLYYFYALSKIKDVSLYSLQQVHGTDQLAYMPKDFAIHTFDETFDKTHGSFTDTAAVMKNLDLVITADTSIAHLAGALGVPVWVILPYTHDSRWTIGQGENRLYENLRLFRQKTYGDWDVVMDQVANELCKIVK